MQITMEEPKRAGISRPVGLAMHRIRHGSKVVVARAAAGIASGCSRVEKRIQVPISAVHGGCEPELALLLTDRRVRVRRGQGGRIGLVDTSQSASHL